MRARLAPGLLAALVAATGPALAQTAPATPPAAVAPAPLVPPPLLVPNVAVAPAPSADEIVNDHALPLTKSLANATASLQNAVIRYCRSSRAAPLADVAAAFRATTAALAAAEPFALGTDIARGSVERLMTETASTAFGLNRLEAMMSGRIAAPVSLAELRAEDLALQGLPAMERLLLRGEGAYEPGETKANRCRLALVVAAQIRATARDLDRAWADGLVGPHWGRTPPELADRLRLRDLIQAMLDAGDRLVRDVTTVAGDTAQRGELPFSDHALLRSYLGRLAIAMADQTVLLARLAQDAAVRETLEGLRATLAQGALALDRRDRTVEAADWLARAQLEVADLPEAFGFDRAAFQRPIASFDAPVNPAPVAPR